MPNLVHGTHSPITDQFVAVASALNNHFPQLDLRFNLLSGSNVLRYQVASVSRKIFELELGTKSTKQLVHEAIFNLKEVARLFDA